MEEELRTQIKNILLAYSMLEEYCCLLVENPEENTVITKANAIVEMAQVSIEELNKLNIRETMKQTAMQSLLLIVKELKANGQEVDTNGLEDWINSVGIGMEREQIIEAYDSDNILEFGSGEQYYNETYKNTEG